MSSLFPDEEDAPAAGSAKAPLAERMRPRTFDEFVGQSDLLAPGRPLREAIERDLLQSIILWGPPGTGKTTIARLLAKAAGYEFMQLSAVFSGVADLKKALPDCFIGK